MKLRIGNGYDVHAFDEVKLIKNSIKNHITLGGIEIPHEVPLKAHSDGDVLIHAVCDALLGALALGDIGHHFPDTDEAFKGVNSQLLLKQVVSLIEKEGYQLNNCDCTIVAQSPKMAPHIIKMRERMSGILNVAIDAVSVKATTTEHLGFTGRKEGIAVYAVVLLIDSND
jgi:2-C-methyl-D-erythritol 2,4-cyclodiphosphate synthase